MVTQQRKSQLMRPGWNPTRRNKHVGTKAHGHGNDNRMVVPEAWGEYFLEKLGSHVLVKRQIKGREMLFFVQPARPGCFYPCSIDDICKILADCPDEATSAFDFIVLRQPTRKQGILQPVWGRAEYTYDIRQQRGAAVIVEAQMADTYIWTKSANPERVRELNRLRQDGHHVEMTRRGVQITRTAQSLRNTILYRTLLHEIGHHLDANRSTDEEWQGKTAATKEDYAHRFATELYASLEKQGAVPFPHILDDAAMLQDGVKCEWFCVPDKNDACFDDVQEDQPAADE